MKLFKNAKQIKKLLQDNPIGEYIALLNEGITIPDVAKKYNMTRQNLHLKLIKYYKELEVIEPNLINLAEEFDTYLNLNKVVPEYMVSSVFRYIHYKNKQVRSGILLDGTLVDKRLKFSVVWEDAKTKKKPLAVSDGVFKILNKEIPISIVDFAKNISMNEERLREYFYELLCERVYIYKDIIVSVRFNSLIHSVSVFAKEYYDGSLCELYDYLYDDMKIHHKDEKISKESFYKKLLIHKNFEKDTFCYLEDGSYEFTKYAKKHKIKYLKINKENNLANQRKKRKSYIDE